MRAAWSVLAAAMVVSAFLIWPNGGRSEETVEREGGIVGTGILGEVDALGSIEVLDQRIVFESGFIAETPIGSRPASAIQPGDVVLVEAQSDRSFWRAKRIQLHWAVLAPIAISAEGEATLLGADVVFARDTARPSGLKDGAWVGASGFWRGEIFVATRLELLPPQKQVRVVGSYLGATAALSDGANGFRLGGVRIFGLELQHAELGDVLTVTGRAVDGGVAATAVKKGLFSDAVGVALAEGYLSAPSATGHYTVLGAGLVAYTENPSMIDPSTRVVYCGVAHQRGLTPRAASLDREIKAPDQIIESCAPR